MSHVWAILKATCASLLVSSAPMFIFLVFVVAGVAILAPQYLEPSGDLSAEQGRWLAHSAALSAAPYVIAFTVLRFIGERAAPENRMFVYLLGGALGAVVAGAAFDLALQALGLPRTPSLGVINASYAAEDVQVPAAVLISASVGKLGPGLVGGLVMHFSRNKAAAGRALAGDTAVSA